MKENVKKHNLKKRIVTILVILIIAIIPVCFLYSLIELIIEPSNVFVIENRKNLRRRIYSWIYNKKRESTYWRKL